MELVVQQLRMVVLTLIALETILNVAVGTGGSSCTKCGATGILCATHDVRSNGSSSYNVTCINGDSIHGAVSQVCLGCPLQGGNYPTIGYSATTCWTCKARNRAVLRSGGKYCPDCDGYGLIYSPCTHGVTSSARHCVHGETTEHTI